MILKEVLQYITGNYIICDAKNPSEFLHACFEDQEMQELYNIILTENDLISIYGWTVEEISTEYDGSTEPYMLIKVRPYFPKHKWETFGELKKGVAGRWTMFSKPTTLISINGSDKFVPNSKFPEGVLDKLFWGGCHVTQDGHQVEELFTSKEKMEAVLADHLMKEMMDVRIIDGVGDRGDWE